MKREDNLEFDEGVEFLKAATEEESLETDEDGEDPFTTGYNDAYNEG